VLLAALLASLVYKKVLKNVANAISSLSLSAAIEISEQQEDYKYVDAFFRHKIGNRPGTDSSDNKIIMERRGLWKYNKKLVLTQILVCPVPEALVRFSFWLRSLI